MCSCGQSNQSGIYSVGMWNTNYSQSGCGHKQECNGCLDITKSDCIAYTGENLTNSGINKDDTLTAILKKLDVLKQIQDSKNAKILEALNNINTRLNALENSSHAPYTLL